MFKYCLARQINEVEVLKSFFCGERELIIVNEDKYELLKGNFEAKRLSQADDTLPISINIKIPFSDASISKSVRESVFINVKMPPFYPSAESAEVQLYGTNKILTQRQEDALKSDAYKFLQEKIGQECILDLVHYLRDWVEETAKRAKIDALKLNNALSNSIVPKSKNSTTTVNKPPQKMQDFRRVLLWFSTIAPDRAKTISEWARRLDLTGISRLGSPALIVVEGLAEDVTEYISSIRTFRWKKWDIVWEDKCKTHNISECRKFPQFQECMITLTELQPIYRKAGLEEMFREGLKIRG